MTFRVSNDASKVLAELARNNITFNRAEDFYGLEFSLGTYYPNHILTVVKKIIKPQNVERILNDGWEYFLTPINSILGPREPAKRETQYGYGDLSMERYSMIVKSFLVANFNSTEAAMLFDEISTYTDAAIREAIVAAKNGNKRTIYYLNGILKRSSADRMGKLDEITKKNDAAGEKAWQADSEFEAIDAGERAALLLDWEEKQKLATIRKTFHTL